MRFGFNDDDILLYFYFGGGVILKYYNYTGFYKSSCEEKSCLKCFFSFLKEVIVTGLQGHASCTMQLIIIIIFIYSKAKD